MLLCVYPKKKNGNKARIKCRHNFNYSVFSFEPLYSFNYDESASKSESLEIEA